MIHYQLRCAAEHEFDGWFANSASFDAQASRAWSNGPTCGSGVVERALMAPGRVEKEPAAAQAAPAGAGGRCGAHADGGGGRRRAGPGPCHAAEAALGGGAQLRLCRRPNSPRRRARSTRAKATARGIYGEATPDEAEALAEEGIEVAKIPWVPRADG